MAIDALLLATKLNLDARSLYIGAIADSLSRWLADEGPGEDLLSKGLYSSIAISLDQQRLGYQLAKQHFPNIHSNDLVPLGRVIVHMMSGQSQSNSISSAQREQREIMRGVDECQRRGMANIPPRLSWPQGLNSNSYEAFRTRLRQYTTVLPYVYFYFLKHQREARWNIVPPSENACIPPELFDAGVEYFWKTTVKSGCFRKQTATSAIVMESH